LDTHVPPTGHGQGVSRGWVTVSWVTAILAEGEHVIHALESVGKVVEHRLDARWVQRCIAAWRFPGIF